MFESSQNLKFENFQNITSDNKSRNARASSHDTYSPTLDLQVVGAFFFLD